MGQLVTTLLSLVVVLLVPLGVMQVHAVLQVENELIDVSLAAAKFASNRGGTSDSDMQTAVRQFIRQELAGKMTHINESDVVLTLSRVTAADPVVWSHGDEFRLRLQIPYPVITERFGEWTRPITIERVGTINVMDYDL